MIIPAHGKPGYKTNNVGFVEEESIPVPTSKGAVFPPSGGDDEETVDFTQKETTTTTTPKKQKSAMKTIFGGMFTPTAKQEEKQEEKQPSEDPSKTLPGSTKTSQKDVTVKDAAVGETEQMFDPDTLDIDKSTRNQLIGFINYKRGVTDYKLLNKSKPLLLDMAKSIKEEEAEEAKAKRKAARAAKKASTVVI